MLSNKPYLIRAFYDWIADSRCTPLLVIDTSFPHCKVPQEFVEDNEIILNISPHAIRDFSIGKERVEFRASFSGVIHLISVPVKAVKSIYAEENGQGMFFEDEETDDGGDMDNITETVSTLAESTTKKASHLRLVE
ncbi:hypothetical protein AYO45_01295 [Gammaproteobacteria bacterium SCGC AG-212-F23]|nr:hypothetical protein AYO45_01295 [Gammaproteobacteria bacterium SCGC AG-212-F23]